MKCGLVSPGALREPVAFQARTRTGTGDGGYTEGWATYRSTQAHVKAASGREVWAGDRVDARSMWKVTCRYFPGLQESDRLVIRGEAYNIRHVDNVELRNRWLVITAEQGAAS